MDSQQRVDLPERNPVTHAQHRKEVFWQISLPLIFGILVVLAAVGAIIFSAIRPAAEINRWAGVSLIWLILPALFISLLFLIILSGIIYAFSVLIRVLPRYTYVIQHYFGLAQSTVSRLTKIMVEPIIRIRSFSAVVRQVTRRESKVEGSD